MGIGEDGAPTCHRPHPRVSGHCLSQYIIIILGKSRGAYEVENCISFVLNLPNSKSSGRQFYFTYLLMGSVSHCPKMLNIQQESGFPSGLNSSQQQKQRLALRLRSASPFIFVASPSLIASGGALLFTYYGIICNIKLLCSLFINRFSCKCWGKKITKSPFLKCAHLLGLLNHSS